MYKKGDLRNRQRTKNAVNAATQLLQEWDDRLELGTTNLLKRYLEGKLGIHLHCEIRLRDGHCQQLCAVFQGQKSSVKYDGTVLIHKHVSRTHNNDGDHPMLVDVIEILQHPQRILMFGGSSMIGLHPLNECAGGLGDVLYQGASSFYIYCRRVKDRKLSKMFRWSMIPQGAQFKDGMVKSGAQLVGHFTGEQHEINRWLAEFGGAGDQADKSSIRIFLESDRVRMAFQKHGDVSVKLLDVLIGPFDLGESSI
jgi:hypothetical protein